MSKRQKTGPTSYRVTSLLNNAYQLGSMAYSAYRRYSGRRTRARMSQRRGRSYTQTRTKKRYTSGRGVTQQHDRQLIYSKKTMPYRKKKKWLAFKGKVDAVSEKQLGTQTVIFNKRFNTFNQDPTRHGTTTLALYPCTSNETHLNDLTYLDEMDNVNNPTAASGTTVDATTKYIFKSAVLDVTMRNNSQLLGSGLDSQCILEVDIYEMIIKRKTIAGLTQLRSMEEILNEGFTETRDVQQGSLPPLTTSGLTTSLRGVTPFDCPQAIGKYGIKILKKTKLFIGAGQTSTYQIRDPKRHVLSRARMADTPGVNMPGCTRFLFIVHKASPGIVVGDTPGETRTQLEFGITRKYSYIVEGRNEIRDRYVEA